jgi:hypothetical protein
MSLPQAVWVVLGAGAAGGAYYAYSQGFFDGGKSPAALVVMLSTTPTIPPTSNTLDKQRLEPILKEAHGHLPETVANAGIFIEHID